MKRVLLWLFLVVAFVLPARAGTSAIYENFGFNDFGTTPPQIDALAFANYGTFQLFSTLPYDFQNTLYFTNKGDMIGSAGFQFDAASSLGPRRPSANFINGRGASVVSQDGGFSILIFPGGAIFNILPSYLLATATNVVNEGLLSVGAAGLLHLKGDKVNLSRGGLEVRPLEGFGIFPTPTNFIPDIGITDLYWGGITNQLMNSSNLVRPFDPFFAAIQTPPHSVTNANGFVGNGQFSIPVAEGWVFTQFPSPTNWIVQAAFVGLSDPAFRADVRFADSPTFTNLFKTPVVQLTFTETNVVTLDPLTQSLYVLDRLASFTNYNMLTNLAVFPPTYLPANYEISRLPLFEFFTGQPANDILLPNLIYDASYSNVVVTNLYSAYAAGVAAEPVQLQQVPGLSITNQPGRVVIESKELDMNLARVRGNTFVQIQTDHLITSSNAVVDSPNLSFSLASTNGNLRVQNLAKDMVSRLGGTVRAWSGLWTNNVGFLVTNMVEEPPGSGMFTNVVATNVVEIGIHVFVLDASLLQTLEPVLVHDFVSRSTNVNIRDNMQVVNSFLLEADTFTLDGNVTLSSNVRDWTERTAPQLMYFTNQGSLTIENFGHIGSDRAQPYEVIHNRGQMTAESFALRAKYFENNGSISSAREISISADTAKVEGGGFSPQGDLLLSGGSFKFRNSAVSSQSGLHFSVTNSLSDSGGDAANSWSCQDGFHASQKPTFGDLLGTLIRTTAPRFAEVPHTWPAEDRGPSPAGYTNNLAIGRLNLDVGLFAALSFQGAGTNNALYVDFLELDPAVASDLESTVVIDDDFVVYFADANVPVEELDGRLGGRLVWVRDFAGPNSSVDVLLFNGQTVKMNRALRDSLTIDSDGDGVANGLDAYPLDAAVWTSVALTSVTGNSAPLISWNAQPSSIYVLEYTASLTQPDWKPLTTLTNDALTPGILSMVDTNGLVGSTQRFYRIRRQTW
jgi:hypothetical protein